MKINICFPSLFVVILLVCAAAGSAQTSGVNLPPATQMRIARLAPDVSMAEEIFKVDDAVKLEFRTLSNRDNVLVTIVAPNGQEINANNVGKFGGTYNYYEVPLDNINSYPVLDASFGFHYTITFDSLGEGDYTVRYESSEVITEETALYTYLSSDTTIGAKLFTTTPVVRSYQGVYLALALFDDVTPITGATVELEIVKPNGDVANLTLIDSGKTADSAAGDGLYSGFYAVSLAGEYWVRAHVTGMKSSGVAFELDEGLQFTVLPLVCKLTGGFTDYGVDADNNQLFEKIVIEIGTDTRVAGEYGVLVHLLTNNGQRLMRAARANLEIGMGNIQVDFDADSIIALDEDGPYQIEQVDLIRYTETGTNTIQILKDLGQTQAYQRAQMQFPEIYFTNNNTVTGIDTNENGKYEFLKISAEIRTTQQGPYGVVGDLVDSNGNVIEQFSSEIYVSSETQVVDFMFKGTQIVNNGVPGPYHLRNVLIWNEFGLALRAGNLVDTPAYTLDQFDYTIKLIGPHSVTPIDMNANGKYEVLRVETEVDANIPEEITGTWGADLRDVNGKLIDTLTVVVNLTPGTNHVTFNFSGYKIRDAAAPGPLQVLTVQFNSGDETMLFINKLLDTPSYTPDQFDSNMSFTGVHSSHGVDLNSNGKFEYLETNSEIFILGAGEYDIKADLLDSQDQLIISLPPGRVTFTEGMNNLRFSFNGAAISAHQVNGAYKIANVSVYKVEENTMNVPLLFETSAYLYADFETTTTTMFTGNNSAVGVDTNNNGKFDLLRVHTDIFIPVSGHYKIEADLLDSQGAVIGTDSNLTVYEIEMGLRHPFAGGVHTIELEYNGMAINGNDVDGPYTIGNVHVRGVDDGTFQVRDFDVAALFDTEAFTISQFEAVASNLDYVSYQTTPVTGDGDTLFEPGENAELLIKLWNTGEGVARNVSASISSDSPYVEILSAASNYPNIRAPEEKVNTTPFVIKLKPDAPRHSDILINVTFDSDSEEPETIPIKIQTGLLNKIVYVNRANSRRQIYQMNSDGSSKTNLSNNGGDEFNPFVSPDGMKIAYTAGGSLLVMDADGGNKQELDPSLAIESQIAWSSDSTRIAYEKVVSGFNRDIFVIPASGGTPVQLTNTAQSEIRVAWAPNSEKIAYTRGSAVYSINSDGTGETQVSALDNTPVYNLAWSPDGNYLAWIEWPGRVYFVSSSGGTKTTVDFSVSLDTGLSWSPDSTRIAYVKEGFGSENGLGFAGIDGTPFFGLNGNTIVTSMAWAPNGQRIVFANQEPLGTTGVTKEWVRVINIDGTGNTRLSNITASTVSVSDKTPRWRPLDVVPPTSGISITPSANSNGWNTSNVTAGVNAVDNQYGSGVQNHTYGISGAQTASNVTVNNDSSTFTVFREGVSTVTYFARDNAENIETGKTLAVKIDRSLPISHHSLNNGGADTTFTLSAVDVVSGIDQITYSVDGGTAQTYTAPFAVSNTGGHTVTYFARDLAGNEENPRTVYINPGSVPKSVLISEFRARGSLGADDEFIELYNNGENAVDIGGWTLGVKEGGNTPFTLATIPTGTTVPGRGHYLLRKAGSSNYSLADYAEADQTYTGAFADNSGIKLVSGSSVTIDAVGFASVTDATYREGTGLTPSAGISTSGQYSFTRNFSKNIPIDSNNNKTDFVFVSTEGATFNNLKAVLGSPGPENLASPIYREGNILVTQIDDNVTLAEAPNRVYDYTPSPPYSVGILSVRRRLTNNTGSTITRLRVRITGLTTKNSPVSFPQQAVLRLMNSANITVTSADGQTTIPLSGLANESIPITADGGLNSTLTLSLGGGGLANNASLNIDLKCGIVTNGIYKLDFSVETLPAP